MSQEAAEELTEEGLLKMHEGTITEIALRFLIKERDEHKRQAALYHADMMRVRAQRDDARRLALEEAAKRVEQLNQYPPLEHPDGCSCQWCVRLRDIAGEVRALGRRT